MRDDSRFTNLVSFFSKSGGQAPVRSLLGGDHIIFTGVDGREHGGERTDRLHVAFVALQMYSDYVYRHRSDSSPSGVVPFFFATLMWATNLLASRKIGLASEEILGSAHRMLGQVRATSMSSFEGRSSR